MGGDEQYCNNGATFTYNSDEKHVTGIKTKGGYSDHVVVDQECAPAPYALSTSLSSVAGYLQHGFLSVCLTVVFHGVGLIIFSVSFHLPGVLPFPEKMLGHAAVISCEHTRPPPLVRGDLMELQAPSCKL